MSSSDLGLAGSVAPAAAGTAAPRRQPDPDAVVGALRELRGVRSAQLGDGGLLTLDLEDDADEVEVATSVSRLLAGFGLGVDPGQVQLVEALQGVAGGVADGVAGNGVRAGAGPEPGAVAVSGMQVTSTGRRVSVTVTLCRDGRECAGEAVGSTSTAGTQRAVAEATLHALEELTDDAVIGRIERLEVGAQALVALMLDVDGRDLAASGSSPVQADERQAIVRAILLAAAPHLP